MNDRNLEQENRYREIDARNGARLRSLREEMKTKYKRLSLRVNIAITLLMVLVVEVMDLVLLLEEQIH